MGLPFAIVQGTVLIADTYGNITGTKSISGELEQDGVSPLKRMATNTVIQGGNLDGGIRKLADVVNETGRNRLAVLTSIDPGGTVIPSLTNTLQYDDMNVASGGVARGTTIGASWVRLYSSNAAPIPSSKGLLVGLIITLEKIEEDDPAKTWVLRVVVDGIEMYGSAGIRVSDLSNASVYGYLLDPNKSLGPWIGFDLRENSVRWGSPNGTPIRYTSEVQVYARKLSDSKKFRAGLVQLTKD